MARRPTLKKQFLIFCCSLMLIGAVELQAQAVPDAAPAAPAPASVAPSIVQTPPAKKTIVTVDPMQEAINQALDAQFAKAMKEAWFSRIKLATDVRVRYQGDFYDDTNNYVFLNPASPTTIMNTTIDRTRFRTRARLTATFDLQDGVETGIRISTGSDSPISANQTMGADFKKYLVGVDLAYGKWTPTFFPYVNITAGRMKNPFNSTDLVWNSNLTLDGATVAGSFPLEFKELLGSEVSFQVVPSFATGAYPLEEIDFSTNDKYLFGGQISATMGLVAPKPDSKEKYSPLTLVTSGAAYWYTNTKGVLAPMSLPTQNDYTAPGFQQKGNTLYDINPNTTDTKIALAADYLSVDVIETVRVGLFYPFNLDVTAEYVRNVAYNKDDVSSKTGSVFDPQVNGYYGSIRVGFGDKPAPGTFSILASYRFLEADAVLDAFTDSDFHGGGTNTKGYTIGGNVWLTKNVGLTVNYMSANFIVGPHWGQDTLLVDTNFSF